MCVNPQCSDHNNSTIHECVEQINIHRPFIVKHDPPKLPHKEQSLPTLKKIHFSFGSENNVM